MHTKIINLLKNGEKFSYKSELPFKQLLAFYIEKVKQKEFDVLIDIWMGDVRLYHCKKNDLRNLSLLGTVPDQVLAKRWDCSRQSIRNLRKKYGIPLFKETHNKYEKKIYDINTIKYTIYFDCRGLTTWSKCTSLNHSISYYMDGCRCDICKLCNSIMFFLKKSDLKTNNDFINIMANTYVNLYKSDESKKKNIFYLFLLEKYEELKSSKSCFAEIADILIEEIEIGNNACIL